MLSVPAGASLRVLEADARRRPASPPGRFSNSLAPRFEAPIFKTDNTDLPRSILGYYFSAPLDDVSDAMVIHTDYFASSFDQAPQKTKQNRVWLPQGLRPFA